MRISAIRIPNTENIKGKKTYCKTTKKMVGSNSGYAGKRVNWRLVEEEEQV